MSTPDGLDPPGEQLEIPWDGPAPRPAEVVETIVHRVTWGPWSWSCACGAGREWPGVAPPGVPRASARVHMGAVRRRMNPGP
jgi:hypothetical protein